MSHPLSLAAQAASLIKNLPNGVVSCSVTSKGYVDLVLHVDSTRFSYGIRPWVLRVGGEGIGDEVGSVSAMYGGTIKSPVAVRFIQIGAPFAMHGVDDTGFVSSMFWDEVVEESDLQLRAHPSLRKIAQQAVRWLTGAHVGAKDVVRAASTVASTVLVSDSTAVTSNVPACGINKDNLTRWLELENHTFAKVQVIDQYQSLCKNVEMYNDHFCPEWLAPAFQQFFQEDLSKKSTTMTTTTTTTQPPAVDWLSLVEESSPGIYSFDLFSPIFCQMMTEEIHNFESSSLPRRRPNTMNNYGLIINEIGLEPLMTQLLNTIIAPMCAALYPTERIVQELDHHHTFVVEYKKDGGDRGLDMHHDSSEATLNVCLNSSFTGAGLRFCGRSGTTVYRKEQTVIQHKLGRAVLHLGRHRHGAEDINSGERLNLIIWARSSSYRGAAAYGNIPLDGFPKRTEIDVDQMCLSKTNDHDYEMQLQQILLQKKKKKSSLVVSGGDEALKPTKRAKHF